MAHSAKQAGCSAYMRMQWALRMQMDGGRCNDRCSATKKQQGEIIDLSAKIGFRVKIKPPRLDKKCWQHFPMCLESARGGLAAHAQLLNAGVCQNRFPGEDQASTLSM